MKKDWLCFYYTTSFYFCIHLPGDAVHAKEPLLFNAFHLFGWDPCHRTPEEGALFEGIFSFLSKPLAQPWAIVPFHCPAAGYFFPMRGELPIVTNPALIPLQRLEAFCGSPDRSAVAVVLQYTLLV